MFAEAVSEKPCGFLCVLHSPGSTLPAFSADLRRETIIFTELFLITGYVRIKMRDAYLSADDTRTPLFFVKKDFDISFDFDIPEFLPGTIMLLANDRNAVVNYGLLTVFASRVTAVCASARPFKVAPVLSTIAVWSRIFPLNADPVPRVVWPATTQ